MDAATIKANHDKHRANVPGNCKTGIFPFRRVEKELSRHAHNVENIGANPISATRGTSVRPLRTLPKQGSVAMPRAGNHNIVEVGTDFHKRSERGQMKEFHSFYKEPEGGEGVRCHYPTRLDTYGCGCAHDCSYCYAKSLLDFRGLWDAKDPAVADITEIRKVLDKVPRGTILRLGGMTDCFQECERTYKVTLKTIKELNKRGIGYLIVTKSDLVADDEYINVMDKDLAHIQITVTCLDDDFYIRKQYEKAPLPSKRIAAILKLQEAGFDVAIRLSPLMEEYMEFDKLNSLGIKKGIVEFLRVNHWILKWFDVDKRKYVIKDGGYRHLRIKEKVRIISKIKGMELSVCEDVGGHYNYWRYGFNPDPEDCCNLRKRSNK